jgi:hypothetical protein
VDVILDVGREIVVDDKPEREGMISIDEDEDQTPPSNLLDIANVETSRSNIGCNEDGRFARTEFLDDPV